MVHKKSGSARCVGRTLFPRSFSSALIAENGCLRRWAFRRFLTAHSKVCPSRGTRTCVSLGQGTPKCHKDTKRHCVPCEGHSASSALLGVSLMRNADTSVRTFRCFWTAKVRATERPLQRTQCLSVSLSKNAMRVP